MSALSERTGRLVRLSAALAAGDQADAERELRAATDTEDLIAVDEAILQTVLFLGFPVALWAAATWRALRGDAPDERDPLAATDAAAARAERGEDYCREVYGSAYERLRRNVADAHPALDRWMVETGYGTVLGRPGLPRTVRELCLVAILAAQARDEQLHSHLRGALRTGATSPEVEAALEIGLRRAPSSARDRLRGLWSDVRERNDDVH